MSDLELHADLTAARIAYDASAAAMGDYREKLKEAREAMEPAIAAICVAATEHGSDEMRASVETIAHCAGEIERLTYGEGGTRELTVKVKEAARAMRAAAAAGGNATIAEGEIAAAEEELREKRGELKDIKKAKATAEVALLAAVPSPY